MALALVLLLMACSSGPRDRVVVLPNKDGSPSAVVIRSGGKETVVDKPFAAATVSGKGGVEVLADSQTAVETRYASVLEAQPARPVSFVVYFVSGKDELTPDSRSVLEEIRTELRRRQAPEITVIGHTDRVGTLTYNDGLALQRAQTMRSLLLGVGIGDGNIAVAGRGEREPLVSTADEIDEPRNRRVEISIR
jgi:outer membrane protein OmpA-like peptidoglycan-associated protein